MAAIMQVLYELEEYPEQSRTMIMEGLPHALAHETPKHEYQEKFLSLFQGMLEDARRFAAEKQATAEETSKLEETSLQSLQAAYSEATAAAEAARVAALDQASAMEKARQAVKDAERDHKETEREQSRFDKAFDQLLEEKAKVAYVLEGSFLLLAEGGWEDEDAKASAVDTVQSYLEGIGAEKVLVAAAHAALSTKMDSRKPFDKVTVEHVREVLEEKMRDITAKVEHEQIYYDKAKAELLGAWALADVARDNMLRAEDSCNAAEAARQASLKQQEEAQVGLCTQEAAQKAAVATLQQASEKVRLVEKAFCDFEQLRAGPPPAAEEATEDMSAPKEVDQMKTDPPPAEEEVTQDAEMSAPKDDDVVAKEQALVPNALLGVPTPMSV